MSVMFVEGLGGFSEKKKSGAGKYVPFRKGKNVPGNFFRPFTKKK
jgi:hypothetical protein